MRSKNRCNWSEEGKTFARRKGGCDPKMRGWSSVYQRTVVPMIIRYKMLFVV